MLFYFFTVYFTLIFLITTKCVLLLATKFSIIILHSIQTVYKCFGIINKSFKLTAARYCKV